MLYLSLNVDIVSSMITIILGQGGEKTEHYNVVSENSICS